MLENSSIRTRSVTELNHEIKNLMEGEIGACRVAGEIGNFTSPASGHWYFTLKDEQATIQCCMFRSSQKGASIKPKEGMAVEVLATLSLYVARGATQLIVSELATYGMGQLAVRFEELKKKLAGEGLFDIEKKRAIPEVIDEVGLITSGTGAAKHDVLSTLEKRWPLLRVNFYPTLVQGEGSVTAICRALGRAMDYKKNQILLLVRGGGSLEDLWSFNEEEVVRMVGSSTIPIITGIGHETDFSLCDFASDHRAPTPTAAAVAVSPDQYEVMSAIDAYSERLQGLLDSIIIQQTLNKDYLEDRLKKSHPMRDVVEKQRLVALARTRCINGITRIFAQKNSAVSHLTRTLSSYHPQQVLQRGYAIVRNSEGNVVITSDSVKHNEHLTIDVAKGTIGVQVVADRVK